MEYLYLIIQIVIVLAFIFIVYYIKGLPDRLHKKNIQYMEHNLSKQLEIFKSNLVKEIEILKISETQLQVRKIEEFTKITGFISNYFYDDDYKKKVTDNPKILAKEISDMRTKLFYFASDDTVKKYVEWRKYGINNKNDPHLKESHKIIKLFAELVLLMRKDLGYKNTVCDIDDYLNIILTDWENVKKNMEVTTS